MNENNLLMTFPVIFDDGNLPFIKHNLATIALSLPQIRARAKVGDLLLGLDGQRVVCFFQVERLLPWSEYAELSRQAGEFAGRIPQNVIDLGDAIYPPKSKNPLPSWAGRNAEDYQSDVVEGKNVLVSQHFYYFGRGDQYEITLPTELAALTLEKGFKVFSDPILKEKLEIFFKKQLLENGIKSTGKYGTPRYLPQLEGFDFVMSCNTLSADADGCGAQVEGRVPLDLVRDLARESDEVGEIKE